MKLRNQERYLLRKIPGIMKCLRYQIKAKLPYSFKVLKLAIKPSIRTLFIIDQVEGLEKLMLQWTKA